MFGSNTFGAPYFGQGHVQIPDDDDSDIGRLEIAGSYAPTVALTGSVAGPIALTGSHASTVSLTGSVEG